MGTRIPTTERHTKIAEALRLDALGLSNAEIAEEMHHSLAVVKHLKHEGRNGHDTGGNAPRYHNGNGHERAAPLITETDRPEPTLHASRYGIITYSYAGQSPESYTLPRFDGEPHLHGDWIVTGDVHLPTTDWKLADLLLEVAAALNITNLAIVGDLCNFDLYSKYPHIMPPPPFQSEIETAEKLMRDWAKQFQVMRMNLGNHEHRMLKALQGGMNADWLGRIINAGRGKLEVSIYPYMVLHSGGQDWHLTHQRNYSRIKGRVANQLAQKHLRNVVCMHQHHVAKLRDDWNRFTLIDGGGLFDDKLMAYVKLEDSTSPVMCQGFTVIMNGVGHLITPYDTFTDLDVLLMGMAARRAQGRGR